MGPTPTLGNIHFMNNCYCTGQSPSNGWPWLRVVGKVSEKGVKAEVFWHGVIWCPVNMIWCHMVQHGVIRLHIAARCDEYEIFCLISRRHSGCLYHRAHLPRHCLWFLLWSESWRLDNTDPNSWVGVGVVTNTLDHRKTNLIWYKWWNTLVVFKKVTSLCESEVTIDFFLKQSFPRQGSFL